MNQHITSGELMNTMNNKKKHLWSSRPHNEEDVYYHTY